MLGASVRTSLPRLPSKTFINESTPLSIKSGIQILHAPAFCFSIKIFTKTILSWSPISLETWHSPITPPCTPCPPHSPALQWNVHELSITLQLLPIDHPLTSHSKWNPEVKSVYRKPTHFSVGPPFFSASLEVDVIYIVPPQPCSHGIWTWESLDPH